MEFVLKVEYRFQIHFYDGLKCRSIQIDLSLYSKRAFRYDHKEMVLKMLPGSFAPRIPITIYPHLTTAGAAIGTSGS